MDNNLIDQIKTAAGADAHIVMAIVDFMSGGEAFYQNNSVHSNKRFIQVETLARELRIPISTVEEALTLFEQVPYFQFLPSELAFSLRDPEYAELTDAGRVLASCAFGLAQWPARLIIDRCGNTKKSISKKFEKLIGFTQDVEFQLMTISQKVADCGSIDAYFDWQYGVNSQEQTRKFIKSAAEKWKVLLTAPEVV